MKAMLNPSKTFLHTAVEVKVTADRKIESAELIEDIQEIRLKDTCGRVHKFFEQDLIKGPDRFLVYVFETGDDFYKFDVIIRTDDIEEFINYTARLTNCVVELDFEDQTIVTLV